MNKNIHNICKILLTTFCTLLICVMMPSNAFADQLKLTLKEIGASDNISLKTVKTFRNFSFTKPKSWKVSPTSKMVLTFQHSPQLLPERSSLNILINDEVIKTIELNKANSTTTTATFLIPASILKDYNTLTMDVDQHYTYKCEDPFDPALWTTVLNTSYLSIDYTEMAAKPDFALFPYPIYDNLAYKPAELNFVIPNPEADSDDTLTAMSLIDASIAQKIGWKELKVNVSMPDKLNHNSNLIIVGTPRENAAIKQFESALPYGISNDQIIDTNGNILPKDAGVLMIIPNPNNPASVVLVVTGNSPIGVKKAAIALTQNPTNAILKGNMVVVQETLKNELANLRDWPQFIKTKIARLIDLGLKSETVRGVTSVPIKYSIKIMPDISMPPKNFVKANVVYSYSAHLEPDMSKLEVTFNGVTLHTAKLDNTDGENLKTLELEIPTESVQIFNELEFKFHLFPVKYDICRFTTDEHIWGTIHNTTEFNFPAHIKTVIPDIGLINDGGYPFTAYPDLQDDVFVLADDFNAYDVYAMLWVTARLAKMTDPTDSINSEVVRVANLNGNQKSTKNIIVIGTKDRNQIIRELETELSLIYNNEGFKLLKRKGEEKLSQLRDIPDMGIVEQMLSPWNDKRVVMILYGQDNNGLRNAISLFASDQKFKSIERGNITVVTADTVKTLITLSKQQVRQLLGEEVKRTAATWDFWWNIIRTFLIIVGILAILRILFGAFIRGAKGQG